MEKNYNNLASQMGKQQDAKCDANHHQDRFICDKYTFENFVVGKSNQLAYAAAQRIAESDSAQFNPLFLYSNAGLGKTHLMHAIAKSIHDRNPTRRILYLSAEQFMYRFITALRYKNILEFKDQFRSVDVLMIDDIQFICGKDSTQEEFFHTFNALVDSNHQIIVSADKSPSDLDSMEDRMRSRLGWGLVCDIHKPDYEMRLSILQNKLEQSNIKINRCILELLASKITSSIRELEGALNKLIAYKMLVDRDIEMQNVYHILSNFLKDTSQNKIPISKIQMEVADFFKIKSSDITSHSRIRSVARPRQIAMYFAKKMTNLSLPEIARKFGGKDHTTIMHGIKKIESLMQNDVEISENIKIISKRFMN